MEVPAGEMKGRPLRLSPSGEERVPRFDTVRTRARRMNQGYARTPPIVRWRCAGFEQERTVWDGFAGSNAAMDFGHRR